MQTDPRQSNQQKTPKGNLAKARSKLSKFFRQSPEENSKEDGRMAGRELPRTPEECGEDIFGGSMLGVPAPATFVIPGQNTVVTAPLTMIRHPSRPAGENPSGRHQHLQRVASWSGARSSQPTVPNAVTTMGQHRPLQRVIDRRGSQRSSLNSLNSVGPVQMFYPGDCTLLTPEGDFDSMGGMQPVCFTSQHPLCELNKLPNSNLLPAFDIE